MSDKKLILEQILQELLNSKTDELNKAVGAIKAKTATIKQDPFIDLFSGLFSKENGNIVSLFDILYPRKEDTNTERTATENTSTSTSATVPSIEALLQHYSPLVCETFFHKTKKTKYVLLEIINVNSTDHNKFPVSVIYYDKQLQTKWCRPLVEFHNNFKIVM